MKNDERCFAPVLVSFRFYQ